MANGNKRRMWTLPEEKDIFQEYDKLRTENKRLREGLIRIRKSTEIMEARRFAEQALKGK